MFWNKKTKEECNIMIVLNEQNQISLELNYPRYKKTLILLALEALITGKMQQLLLNQLTTINDQDIQELVKKLHSSSNTLTPLKMPL